ncbi:MAG: hypothetical protein V1897_06980 [Pseudomonadota bacterium]
MNYTKGNWQQGRYGNNQFEVLTDKQIAVVKTSLDDANLIASAPEMYEALKEIKNLVADCAYEQNVLNQIIGGKCFLAITKAEGK